MDPEHKVEICDTKDFDVKRTSRKRKKIVVIGILSLILLLAAVVSLTSFFVLRKTTSNRLAEVNLEEDETLTYRVDQQIEVRGGDVQKGAIRAIVGIRVLNKTSDEYWFLMKFNLSHVDGNMEIKNVNIITEYFLVRLKTGSSRTPKESAESFHVYGHRHTDEELIRQIYGILEQLLPTLKRDLYEDVDGMKVTDSHSLNPEESPLLPDSVRMHREANTSDKDTVLIKNHFDRADFLNLSSDIDLDLKYSDFALINKSNGMVTESHAYFSEQLNFGEEIHLKGGVDSSDMKITITSHVSLIETDSISFGEAEPKELNLHLFVKLIVPKSQPTFSVNDRQPHDSPSIQTSSNVSLPSQQHNSTNPSMIPLKRSRRASNVVRRSFTEAGPLYLTVEHKFTIFEKNLIGIKIKGEGTVSVTGGDSLEISAHSDLIIGGIYLPVFSARYNRQQLKNGQAIRTGFEIQKRITIFIPVFILNFGVDFSLKFEINTQLNFPPEENSLSPVKLALEIEPFAAVTASVQAYVSAGIIRAGAYGDGTLVRIGLPVTLSYQEARLPGQKWCLKVATRLTALEMSAGIFYQWWDWWWWSWGTRHTLYSFGTWAAISREDQLLCI